jgi:hypothetical protein
MIVYPRARAIISSEHDAIIVAIPPGPISLAYPNELLGVLGITVSQVRNLRQLLYVGLV